jgi:hypothetical protein
MIKGEIVGNISIIDVKDMGSLQMSKINITSLHMSKINIARWRLLKVLLLDFDDQFGYPIFEDIFNLIPS